YSIYLIGFIYLISFITLIRVIVTNRPAFGRPLRISGVQVLSNLSNPYGFSPQSEMSGASQSQVPPTLASQALRASAKGGKTQPQALPLDLCWQPTTSRRKRPNSVSVRYLLRWLWAFASSIRYLASARRGFFKSAIGSSPTPSFSTYHCSRPVKLNSFCSTNALV